MRRIVMKFSKHDREAEGFTLGFRVLVREINVIMRSLQALTINSVAVAMATI